MSSASIFRRSTSQPAIPNRRACAKQEDILLMQDTTIWRTTTNAPMFSDRELGRTVLQSPSLFPFPFLQQSHHASHTFGCMAVCAAMANWFRFQMKLDPKANDRVRSSWRLRKSIPSSFREERGPSYDTCANGVLGSVKMRFWAIWRTGSYCRTGFTRGFLRGV
jgi:hypothetical protein